MKNATIVNQMKKTYPLVNVQEAWNKTGDRLNYLLYKGVVYSTANLNGDEIMGLYKDLYTEGTCMHVDSPRRITPALREFLENEHEHELLASMQAKTTLKTRKNRCQLTEKEKTIADYIIELENGLELRSPNQIVSDYLVNLDKKEAKESLVGVIEWYYNEYDMTPIHTLESMGLYEKLDLNEFYEIGFCLTSKKVMQMVVDAYKKHYKKEGIVNLDKVAEYLDSEGFGV